MDNHIVIYVIIIYFTTNTGRGVLHYEQQTFMDISSDIKMSDKKRNTSTEVFGTIGFYLT